MNSKERVMRRLEGKPVDKAPNCNIIMAFGAKYINKPLSQYYLDYRVLVESNIKVNMDFGIDIMSAISDPYRETYDYGAKIEFPYDSIPLCKRHIVEGPGDIKKLKTFDLASSVRMLDRVKAIELYKSEVGEDYPVMGWVECPLAEAADLRGISNVMMDFYDEPEFLEELMEFTLEGAVKFAKAQVEAGADIIGMGDAAASLLSPTIYRQYVLPYEKRLIAAVHEAGAKARLHVCGNINSLLEDMKLCGADMIDVDHMVDFKTACEKLKGYASACGNFDPVRVIRNGTPEQIRKAVQECLKNGDDTTFIMAGCEIPADTPYENLKAVDDALKAYSEMLES